MSIVPPSSDLSGSNSGHTGRGKWSQAGVPKKGWTCTGITDLDEPSLICEMCESIPIRYAHSMEHPDYDEPLQVGCVCAEHMEQDYVRPREREKRLQNQAKRKQNWGNRYWRRMHGGTLFTNASGFLITVLKADDSYVINVLHRVSYRAQRGKGRYRSEDEAMSAAFYALLWAEVNLRPKH